MNADSVGVCCVLCFCGILRHGAVFDSMGCYTILGILMAAELFVQVCGCDDALMPSTYVQRGRVQGDLALLCVNIIFVY